MILDDLMATLRSLPRPDDIRIRIHPLTRPILEHRLGELYGRIQSLVPPAAYATCMGLPIEESDHLTVGIVVLANRSAMDRWANTGVLEPDTMRIIDLRAGPAGVS